MFRCYLCKEDKEASEFHKDRGRTSGLSSKCKDCMKIRNLEKRATPEGKAKRVVMARKWKRENRLKERAHKAVAKAIKSGRLIKPDACSKCGGNEKIEGHHPNYEYRLVVLWLCQKCHQEVHRASR